MLAFPNPLVAVADDFDTNDDSDDPEWADTSSTSCSDLEQNDKLKCQPKPNAVLSKSTDTSEQHAIQITHDNNLNQPHQLRDEVPSEEISSNGNSEKTVIDAKQQTDQHPAPKNAGATSSGKSGQTPPAKRSSRAPKTRGQKR